MVLPELSRYIMGTGRYAHDRTVARPVRTRQINMEEIVMAGIGMVVRPFFANGANAPFVPTMNRDRQAPLRVVCSRDQKIGKIIRREEITTTRRTLYEYTYDARGQSLLSVPVTLLRRERG